MAGCIQVLGKNYKFKIENVSFVINSWNMSRNMAVSVISSNCSSEGYIMWTNDIKKSKNVGRNACLAYKILFLVCWIYLQYIMMFRVVQATHNSAFTTYYRIFVKCIHWVLPVYYYARVLFFYRMSFAFFIEPLM